MRKNSRSPNLKRNLNKNDRRNDSTSDTHKDNVREHVDKFKEVFVKEKGPSSSHVVLEEKSNKLLEGMLKSIVVIDSS